MRTHRPPSACPVCADALITLRLGCPSCGTEVSGHFQTCRFCRLDTADLEILEVFLRGRGNVRDVQAHLQVSYPTARARLTDLLDRLGLPATGAAARLPLEAPGGGPAPVDATHAGPPPAGSGPVGTGPTGAGPSGSGPVGTGPSDRGGSGASTIESVLADLAAGRISVDEAESGLRRALVSLPAQ